VVSLLQHWKPWLWSLGVLAGAIALAIVAHSLLFALAKRMVRRTGGIIDNSLVRYAAPTRWIFRS